MCVRFYSLTLACRTFSCQRIVCWPHWQAVSAVQHLSTSITFLFWPVWLCHLSIKKKNSFFSSDIFGYLSHSKSHCNVTLNECTWQFISVKHSPLNSVKRFERNIANWFRSIGQILWNYACNRVILEEASKPWRSLNIQNNWADLAHRDLSE